MVTQVAGKSRFRQTTDQISSLIILINSVKVFLTKWVLIRTKLNELLPLLAGVSQEIQDSGEDSSYSGQLQTVQETTEFATLLAEKCIKCSYSGKLLMQSDLDIIYVKYNEHIKCLYEVSLKDSFLCDNAIVVTKPGATCSKEDIKFYVNELLSRFKVGNHEMKMESLVCFNEVMQEDERFVKSAMEIEGFVCVLMEFLCSKEADIQEEVLKSLDVICGFEEYKCVLVDVGVVGSFVRVLECGSDLSKKLGTRCLMRCTDGCENAWSVSAHGGVSLLLRILGSECENGGELVGLACGVLRNLLGVEEIKRFIVDDGAIPIFINLVKSRCECTQVSAIEILQDVAFGDKVVTDLIVNEGAGIHVLVHVLDPKSSFSSKTQEMSIRAIMSLCKDSTTLISLSNYDFMDHILYFLHDGDVSIQESSLKAAFWLSGISDDYKKAMGEARFMQELIKFVNAKSFEVREMASETLSNLVSIPRNRKRFVENDQHMSLLMQTIDQEEGTTSHTKLLLPIIVSLSGSNSGRKRILSSGCLKNIEKLADEQVLDARKIVRNLSSNKFIRMIRGFWQ